MSTPTCFDCGVDLFEHPLTGCADSRPLPEIVEGHTMFGYFGHEDGRSCQYHNRLGAWTFSGRMECLRDHPGTTP